MKSRTKGLLAVALLAGVQTASYATIFNTNPDNNGSATFANQVDMVGTMFTLTSGINVSDVGMFDALGDGSLIGSTTLTLIKSTSGTSTPFTTFTTVGTWSVSSGTSTGGYVYTSTGGTSLAAGLYVLYADANANNNVLGDSQSGDTVPTHSNTYLNFESDVAAFGTVGIGTRFKAVNFQYAVPEPETYAMVAGVGLVAFGLWRRRQ